ncbi:MAG TPA: hypothetical protein VHW91_07810 [Candidatus Dormibacteraeota bacterium]|nr:hypothetical protein [Candidatus Dormibacteraeota bacterium]
MKSAIVVVITFVALLTAACGSINYGPGSSSSPAASSSTRSGY